MKIRIVPCLFVVISVLTVSCLKSSQEYEKEEAAQIQKYLEDNPSLEFVRKSSGLYYLELVPGTGSPVTSGDSACVFYSLKLLSGKELDSNIGTTDTLIFPVNEGYVIDGFDEGVSYMKPGGKSVFLVPSSLAYGAAGNYYNIPGYTPILFTVQLVRVK